jgi:hypothetical protein
MNKNNKSLIKTIIFIILFSLIFPQNLTFSQTTQTFTKNDWSNPSDFATSSNINFGPDLKITSISSLTTHTSDIDFQNGTFNTTTVREKGSGSDSKVELGIERIGTDWNLAVSKLPSRAYHSSVVFNNKMWILGGTGAFNFNDVLSSDNGGDWEIVSGLNITPWSGRYGHTSVVFDNKIWVIGGYDGGWPPRNDVWYSSDGINWTLATDNAPWSGRWEHTSVVFDNKIWVIGGIDDNWPPRNDVWYSSDGINWTLANDNAPWSGRYGHTSVVFDNKIWVIGGYDGSGLKNDVWYSSDGINWTLATDTALWSERAGHTSVVFDNKILVIGGYDGNNFLNDVWYSSDGINWTLATDNAPWSGRWEHTSVVFDNKIWVIGGIDNNWSLKNDVWYSSDGINWTLATDTAFWSARVWHTSVVFDNKILVIGGIDDNWPPRNDVWYSSDGINWTLANDNAPWSGRYGHTSVVFDNKIWVIGGYDGSGLKNDVWYSSDGINWTLATDTALWSERAGHTSVVFDNKILVIGGYDGNNFLNDVWYSSDGINWTLANDNAPWSGRFAHTSVVFDNKIWVIGGYDGSGLKNDVWYSSDGINWTLATDTALWSERAGHTSVVFDNKILVIGGYDGNNFLNDVWYSSDGINWTLATATAPWSGRYGHTSVVFDNKIWVIGGYFFQDVWYTQPFYYSSGEYISPAIDTTRPHNFSILQFNIQKPTSTDIKFQLSSSEDSITWTDFLGPDGTTSTFYTTSGQTINPIHTGHRYIRYKAFFETTNNTLTPSLNDITINYQYFPTSSFLISNPIDTNQENTQFLTLRYDEITPTGTQIIVSLRTANNLSDLNSALWHSYSSTNPKCHKSSNTVTCDLTNPLPYGRHIQYKIEMLSDELNTPIFDNLSLTYLISQAAPRQIIPMTGGSVISQVKYLLQNKQYDLARKIILEYPHLLKRDYLLKEYPNLFTQEELNFISSVLGEYKIEEYKIEQIIPLLSQISKQQEQKQQISKTTKYHHLKEKLQKHPLKNELKNFRFKKVLKEGMRNKDVKYLQIILNLDNDTKIKDKGLGSFTKETEYFGYFTKQAVIKFQEKYKEDILKPINKDKGTGIVGIMTIMKLNEILEDITK